MLYILPNPSGGKKGGRGRRYHKRTGKVATRGPGLPTSMRPTVWRPPARRAHPPSKRKAGRKILKALGGKKWFRHRIVFWSKSPKGGDEGVRTPYYVKGNAMARRRKSRKYGRRHRRNSTGLLLTNRRHRRKHRKNRARARHRRNPFVLSNRRRKGGRRRHRRNPMLVLPNRKRRRHHRKNRYHARRRHRRNPYVLSNRRRKGGRRHYRRNPSGSIAAFSPGRLMSVSGFTGAVKSFVTKAIPVGLGYVGVRLIDSYVWVKLYDMTVSKFNAGKSPVVQNITNTLWDTTTHIITAGIGAGVAVKLLKSREAAGLFAAGVAVNWLRKMAVIWLPEGQIKSILAGYGNDSYFTNDWVEYSYGLPGQGVNDYVEEEPLNDYVEYSYGR